MTRSVSRVLATLATATLAIPLLALPAVASPSSARAVLAGSSPRWATTAADAGALSGSTPISAQVYFTPRGGQAALNSAVTAVSTPSSPSYRQFLSPGQYRDRFGATQTQINSVTSWLRGAGLTVTSVDANNRYVDVSGTAAQARQAFGAALHQYRHNGAVEQAPAGDLTTPANLASQVLAVTGLSSPQLVKPGQASDAPPPSGFANARPCSAYYGQLLAKYQADYKTPLPKFDGRYRDYAVCGYSPSQFRDAYGVTGTGLTGQGVTVAITDAYAAPTIVNDANKYSRNRGEPTFTSGQFTQSLPSARFRAQAQCYPPGWYGEETLDVEAVHGIAPQANIRYYASRSCYDQDFLATLQRTVDENVASYVSNSWGSPGSDETSGLIAAYEQIFEQGALQGIGFLFSSGDSGDDAASTGIKQTDYPTSDPYVTAVGGTSTAIGADGSLIGQAGWGTDKYNLSSDGRSWVPIAPNPFIYGSGGGFSNLFQRPAYQNGVVPEASPPGRGVPDIAMDADPTTGMLIGETQTFPDGVRYGEFRLGGTSLAAPLLAGMQALASESVGGRLGFLNPRIYDLARAGGAAFEDVTRAFDGEANVRPDFANGLNADDGIKYSIRTFGDDSSLIVAPGWDEVTGVGSPNTRYLTAPAG